MSQSVQEFIQSLKYNSDGMIPAIAQDAVTKDILMMAYMNPESLEKTFATGVATYYSRSRQKLWLKGETSGHIQKIKKIRIDCDLDTLILEIEQIGVACHEGYRSCFFREIVHEADGGIRMEIVEEKPE